MAEYKLWCFIEGTDAILRVVISKDKKVARLRQEIHEKCIHSYRDGVDAGRLVLLKVCHLKILCFCSNWHLD